MPLKLHSKLLLAATLIAAVATAHAQVTYDAEEGWLRPTVGGGVSGLDPAFAQGSAPDYLLQPGSGQGHRWGMTAWADAGLPFNASWLRPLSLEAQFSTIFAGGPASQQGIKETTVGGGAVYTWRHWQNFRPYAKYIFSYGIVSFHPALLPTGVTYSHDSRATNGLGGGIEFRLTHRIWLRAEYERQFWGSVAGSTSLQPQAVTIGAMYSLRGRAHP